MLLAELVGLTAHGPRGLDGVRVGVVGALWKLLLELVLKAKQDACQVSAHDCVPGQYDGRHAAKQLRKHGPARRLAVPGS